MISFSIKGTEELTDLIRRVGKFINELHNRQDLNQMLKEEQNKRWARNFATQGGEYEDWIDTSMAQQQRRIDAGKSPTPTLRITGRTQAHFLEQNDEATITNSAVNWNFTNRIAGRDGQYTVSHHTGYNLGKSTVPARLLWDLDDEDEDRGEQDVELWVEAAAEKHFG